MHWLEWLNCLTPVHFSILQFPILNFWVGLTGLAPIFSALAAMANLGLAFFIFGYTIKKNAADTKIKWFLELVYSPNKESFNAYFKSLISINEQFIPGGKPLSEQQKIEAMDFVKQQQIKIRYEFVEVLKFITPDIYKEINKFIENLTDDLVKTLDNDELKLENQKTYSREIIGRIMEAKGNIIKAIFGYKG